MSVWAGIIQGCSRRSAALTACIRGATASPSRAAVVLVIVLLFGGRPAQGLWPILIESPSVALYAANMTGATSGEWVFIANRSDSYVTSSVGGSIGELRNALWSYAYDHQDRFPDHLSQLFTEGYITEPCTFYNPGDADPAPTTIDNDTPNAPNSAQISFEYLAGGMSLDDVQSGTIILRDNALANNAGLGRTVLYGDTHVAFEEDAAHVFTPVDMLLGPCAEGQILRAGSPWEDYSLPLPDGVTVQTMAAPHAIDVLAEGTRAAEYLDVFSTEGFGNSDSISYSANHLFSVSEMTLTGTAGQTQPVTAYAQFEARISSALSGYNDNGSLQLVLSWAPYDGTTVRPNAFLAMTRYGLIDYGQMVVLHAQHLQPGDEGYIAGVETVDLRGIVQLTADVATDTEGSVSTQGYAQTRLHVTPDSTPGGFGRTFAHLEWAATSPANQIKLFAPPGHVFEIGHAGTGCYGTYLRGDADLDGDVDAVDRVHFANAFTGSKKDPAFVEADFADLQTFDFDGDGDIDCDDYNAFCNAWTAGGSPGGLAQCTPRPRYLSVDVGGQGSVQLDPPGGIYDDGTWVALTAEAESGWDFAGWYGDATGSETTAWVLMDGDKDVIARFESVCNARLAPAGFCQEPGPDLNGVVHLVFGNTLGEPERACESFVVTEAQTVAGLKWWGTYRDLFGRSTLPEDDFTITIYADDGGLPGGVLATFDATNAAFTRTYTGVRLPVQIGAAATLAETEHVARFDTPFEVLGGQTYWVEIGNEPGEVNDLPTFWLWEGSPSGDGAALQDYFNPGYDAADLLTYDLALCPLAMQPLDCPGDLNGDQVVNLSDLAAMFNRYGQTGVGPNGGDLDGDCDVDLDDLAALLGAYGNGCIDCLGDLDGDHHVNLDDLAQLMGHYGTAAGASYTDGDLDLDGDVDLDDLAELLGVYGTSCE